MELCRIYFCGTSDWMSTILRHEQCLWEKQSSWNFTGKKVQFPIKVFFSQRFTVVFEKKNFFLQNIFFLIYSEKIVFKQKQQNIFLTAFFFLPLSCLRCFHDFHNEIWAWSYLDFVNFSSKIWVKYFPMITMLENC